MGKKILFLADAQMKDGSFGPIYQRFIDYLGATQNELFVVKTNRFYRHYTDIPVSSTHISRLKQAIKRFDPDVVFCLNRNGLTDEIVECFAPSVKIITWFTDPYNTLTKSLMRFTERDLLYLFMTDVGFGKTKVDQFLSQFDVSPQQVDVIPFFVDTFTFKPLSLERETDICFVGTAFGNDAFMDIMRFLSQQADKTNLECFTGLFLEHKQQYIFNFYDTLLRRGFDLDSLKTPLPEVFTCPFKMQAAVDIQISLENRARYLGALADFNTKIFGQPDSKWIALICGVNSDMLRQYQYRPIWELPELARLYNQSKIGFNVQHYLAKDSFSFRVFDIIACQALLFTEAATKFPLEQFGFIENEDFICYHSPDDLREKAQYYLNHEEQRERVAASAYQKLQALESQYSLKAQLAKSFAKAGYPDVAGQLLSLEQEQMTLEHTQNTVMESDKWIALEGKNGADACSQNVMVLEPKLPRKSAGFHFKTRLSKLWRFKLAIEPIC